MRRLLYKVFFCYSNRLYRRVVLVSLGLMISIAIALLGPHALASQSSNSQPSTLQSSPVSISSHQPASRHPNVQLSDGSDGSNGTHHSLAQQIHNGIQHYQLSQFAEAIAQWTHILESPSIQADDAHQVLVWNYLALAYYQLGQWDQADVAIANGEQIIADLDSTIHPTRYTALHAKLLTTHGQLQWARGATDEAIASWQQAFLNYEALGDQEGMIAVQLNHAKALRAQGLNHQSLVMLEAVQAQLEASTPPSDHPSSGPSSSDQRLPSNWQVSLLQELGTTLRQLGYLEQSQSVLKRSIALSPVGNIQSAALLSLGNTQWTLSTQLASIGEAEQSAAYLQQAIDSYASVTKESDSPLLTLQSQINQFRIGLERHDLAEVSRWPELVTQVETLPSNRATIFARLNLGRSLMCLTSPGHNAIALGYPCAGDSTLTGRLPLDPAPSLKTIAQFTADTVAMAKTLKDPLAESYALGNMGTVYELSQQWSEARTLTEQALTRLDTLHAPDATYRWTWQLGRIWEHENQIVKARSAYEQSVAALNTLRQDLLQTSDDIQFSFRDQVEPVYRELVRLRLLRPDGQSSEQALDQVLEPSLEQPLAQALDQAPDQKQLRQAIRDIDSLHVMELRNFLGCDLPQLAQLDVATDANAAILYPIVLADRIALILQQPNQPLKYYEVPVLQAQVEQTIQALRDYLTEPGMTPEVLQEATQLYQWLIAPLEADLAQMTQLKTLVFVLDGNLRNVPMGVLYDGYHYLIEREYGIAIAPQINLFNPQPSLQPLKILAGGVGVPQTIGDTTFPEIQRLQEELEQIPADLRQGSLLLNEEFTNDNLTTALGSGRFSAIHWKTHGVFSSSPNQTYLVTYQDSLNANELGNLLTTVQQDQIPPLDLMVLSACETARGDRRAVLGLAGIAVQSGARSTLSSLWRADDAANTRLMTSFYDALSAPSNTTKAEALHQAQLALLTTDGYPAPYYWATYILVGNWR